MSVPIPESMRQLIAAGHLAHLATIAPDGHPHVSIAWVGLENDQLVIGTMFDQPKLRNMRRDPRVTVSFETETMTPWGMAECLIVRGTAEVSRRRLGRVAVAARRRLPRSRPPDIPADAGPAAGLRDPDHGRAHRRHGALVAGRLVGTLTSDQHGGTRVGATAFHHMGVVCQDMAATERFYTRHFGFQRARVVPLGDGDQIVFLKSGPLYLELFKATQPDPAPAAIGPRPRVPGLATPRLQGR